MAVINFHIWGESISYSMVHGRFLHWPIFLNISKFKLTFTPIKSQFWHHLVSVISLLKLSGQNSPPIWKFWILFPFFLCHIHNLHA